MEEGSKNREKTSCKAFAEQFSLTTMSERQDIELLKEGDNPDEGRNGCGKRESELVRDNEEKTMARKL